MTDKIRHQPRVRSTRVAHRKARSLKWNSGGRSRCGARSGARGGSTERGGPRPAIGYKSGTYSKVLLPGSGQATARRF